MSTIAPVKVQGCRDFILEQIQPKFGEMKVDEKGDGSIQLTGEDAHMKAVFVCGLNAENGHPRAYYGYIPK